jgi:WD40 repeat protein
VPRAILRRPQISRRCETTLIASSRRGSSLFLDRLADAKGRYCRAYIQKHALAPTMLRTEIGFWQGESAGNARSQSHQWSGRACPDRGSFSPDHRLLARAESDGLIHVWDGLSQRRLRLLMEHQDAVFAIAISGDAKSAISGDIHTLILVWNLETGQAVHVLRGHRACVSRLRFCWATGFNTSCWRARARPADARTATARRINAYLSPQLAVRSTCRMWQPINSCAAFRSLSG